MHRRSDVCECGDAFPIQALLKGGAAAEAEAVMRCLPETRHLRYGFRRMWLHDWKGVYVAKGMGYCTDPCICLPRSIEMVRSYDKRKERCIRSLFRWRSEKKSDPEAVSQKRT